MQKHTKDTDLFGKNKDSAYGSHGAAPDGRDGDVRDADNGCAKPFPETRETGIDERVERARKECVYKDGLKYLEKGDYGLAHEAFDGLGNYRDSEALKQRAYSLLKKAEAEALDAGKRRKRRLLAGCVALICTGAAAALFAVVILPFVRYRTGEKQLAEGDCIAAITSFSSAGNFSDAPERVKESRYAYAQQLLGDGMFFEAARAFEGARDYGDAALRARDAFKLSGDMRADEGDIYGAGIAYWLGGNSAYSWAASDGIISAGGSVTIGITNEGTVRAAGVYTGEDSLYWTWKDIVEVGAGRYYAIGLRSDGTVLVHGDTISYTGLTGEGVLMSFYDENKVSVIGSGDDDVISTQVVRWKDITSVAAGAYHAAGLVRDGTVICAGSNYYGQCEVGGWKDITMIAAGGMMTAGLRSDGTVVVAGVCADDYLGWKNIVSVAAGADCIAAVTEDGRVLITGERYDVSSWTDIVAVSVGSNFILGLRADGTVLAEGSNSYGQCNVESWNEVIAISAGEVHAAALRADGSVLVCGHNGNNKLDTEGWELMH